MYNTTYSKQYAEGLASMQFDYHNILRTTSKVYNEVLDIWETHSLKLSIGRLDYYMRNLVRTKGIEVAFACIEPDIDKYTGKVDPTSNNIQFAWRGKELSRGHLANMMKCKRMHIRDTWKMVDNHSYFVKHLGTSLSYHNIYA